MVGAVPTSVTVYLTTFICLINLLKANFFLDIAVNFLCANKINIRILIFGLGGALSIFQGISLFIAVKEFNKTRNGVGWWDAIIKSKDPASFLVVFEDGAAVLGLIIVMILMGISHSLQIPELDGLASVLVGCLLVFVSFILARESRSLLMGEGIAPETRQKIAQLAEKDAVVRKVKTILSTYQSPEEVILMLIIDFGYRTHPRKHKSRVYTGSVCSYSARVNAIFLISKPAPAMVEEMQS